MTKREFVRKAMQLRPTAKYWRELVERAIAYNNVADYKNAKSGTFVDVWPLVGAIHEHCAKWAIYGSMDATTVRKARRRANIIQVCM